MNGLLVGTFLVAIMHVIYSHQRHDMKAKATITHAWWVAPTCCNNETDASDSCCDVLCCVVLRCVVLCCVVSCRLMLMLVLVRALELVWCGLV